MKININHLYQFFLAAKEGSIKQAAKILNVTEPTVSKQIKDFEDFIDISLFSRKNRRLSLTPKGEVIAEKSEKIFELVTELEYMIGEKNVNTPNSLVIGSMALMRHEIDQILDSGFLKEKECIFSFFQADFPTLLSYLEDQRIEIILADYPYVGNSKEFKTFPIYPVTELVAVVSNTMPHDEEPLDALLERLPLVAFDPSFRLQKEIDQYFRIKGITLKKSLQFDCPSLVRRAVLKGHGIAILPHRLVAEDIQSNKLYKISDIDFLSLECWAIVLSARANETIVSQFISGLLNTN